MILVKELPHFNMLLVLLPTYNIPKGVRKEEKEREMVTQTSDSTL